MNRGRVHGFGLRRYQHTVTVILSTGDDVYVTSTGAILADGAFAISSNGANTYSHLITVDGTVSSNFQAILLNASAGGLGNNYVVVGETGIVRGIGSTAIGVAGDNSLIENHGQISGALGVAMVSSDGSSLFNTGSISGSSVNGIDLNLVTDLRMTNTGQVFGYDFGIFAVDSDGVFRNSGEISGGSSGIYLASASASRFVNDAGGNISGGDSAIQTGSGGDTITNRGEISGDVLLGYGADTFKGKSGVVTGTVFGESGNDTLIGSSADNDELSGGDNNDTLKGRNGDDDLAGDAGKDHLYAGKGDDTLTGGTEKDYFHFGRNQDDNTITDFEDGTDRLDLAAFGFKDKTQALKQFFEIGSGSNNKVGFDYKGTFIMIKGADLADIGKADLIV